MRRPRLWLLVVLSGCTAYGAVRAELPSAAQGEQIYRTGVLPSGAPLHGRREQGGDAVGAVGACVNCHRRSGLGSAEGTTAIPPITPKFLFAREAYDDVTLAAAIRSGAGRGGHELGYVMPRYALDDGGMASLIAYLKTLPTTSSPGVSDTTLDFATIVTPDADPVARDSMIAVLNQFVEDKNSFIRGGSKPLRSQGGRIDYRITHRWQLHVWTLSGPPAGWEGQLRRHLEAEPVFAVLSGIGGSEWAPVHRFCEAQRLPCLFPNVAVPVDAESDVYSIYLSKGVLLESELIATRLADLATPHRLLQIYTPGNSGERAAARLRALAPASIESVMRPVTQGDAEAIAKAVGEARADDVVVLWLSPGDLALMGPPPRATAVYLSGTLAGFEHATLPPPWRSVAQLTYPVDLPEARAIRMNYPLRWFQIRHIPVVAEKVQADTYLACGIVSEALNDMLDNFMRDYLIERIESMVSHRQLSAFYPHLGLAPGQRFASKGGYLVHFTEPGGSAISPTTEWIVP